MMSLFVQQMALQSCEWWGTQLCVFSGKKKKKTLQTCLKLYQTANSPYCVFLLSSSKTALVMYCCCFSCILSSSVQPNSPTRGQALQSHVTWTNPLPTIDRNVFEVSSQYPKPCVNILSSSETHKRTKPWLLWAVIIQYECRSKMQ